ncbi:MAG: sulfurtransferase TusA family protein [Promethearchaeota archaeon]
MTNRNECEIVKELDTTGLFCPEPLFEVREMIETLEIGQCFKVLADDPAADEDLHRWAKRTETEVLDFKKDDDLLTFIFRKKK